MPSPTSDAHNEITALNLGYFHLIRSCAAADRAEALIRFGLDEPVLDLICEAPHAALVALASTGKVVSLRQTLTTTDIQLAIRKASGAEISVSAS